MNIYKLIQGDCLQVLPTLENESIDLVVTDPPYFNISSQSWDNQWDNYENYLSWLSRTLIILHKKLVKNGSCYVFTAFGKRFDKLTEAIYSLPFTVTNMILWWHEKSGRKHSKKRFNHNYDVIWFLTKNDDYVFNLDKIRVKHWREFDKRANPHGKNPGCIWYEFNLMIGKHKEQVGHPTQKPEALIKRTILASSNKGDMILDPFLGSGTTMKVAQDLGRSCVGIELSPNYCEMIKKRCFHRRFIDREVKYEFS